MASRVVWWIPLSGCIVAVRISASISFALLCFLVYFSVWCLLVALWVISSSFVFSMSFLGFRLSFFRLNFLFGFFLFLFGGGGHFGSPGVHHYYMLYLPFMATPHFGSILAGRFAIRGL